MVSLWRTVRSIQRTGLKEWWRQMQYIGDAKSGRLVGTDQLGNRYYENYNGEEEVPGRHRWVDYAQHDYNGSQVPPGWHAWITHMRQLPPHEDPIVQKYTPAWQSPYVENLTGTRGAYRPYNTTKPKVYGWEPKTADRA
ncbi:NDUFA12-domain-containing protein [Pterulicium gracile]|uniref:NADH dehydrogenase [ubiquinone] 1 alpha subcomplex subunit n=1 Tax=Pterulicium gracile TaxID=1884261 RepID=A0A5C3QVZ2_9AGAR|nr:NDUFA12-domain-containing protein [Pterula gracilis]